MYCYAVVDAAAYYYMIDAILLTVVDYSLLTHHFVDPSTMYRCSTMSNRMFRCFRHHQSRSMICTNEDYNVIPIDCSAYANVDGSIVKLKIEKNNIFV